MKKVKMKITPHLFLFCNFLEVFGLVVPLGVLDAIVPGVVVGPGVEVSSYLACRWQSDDAWGLENLL